MRTTDTIAAIATAVSASGIGIIRVSGPEAVAVVDSIFDHDLKDKASHTIHYGHIVENGEIIDEVLVMLMRAPRSYTGEDTVEIDCHGGVLLLRRVLAAVFRAGAAPAEPGEFTKRAFLNGKMDLSRAEAVIDVIEAKSRDALKAGIGRLTGRLSDEIKSIRAVILNETAYIEAALDDPEHYDLTGYPEQLSETLSGLKQRLEKLLRSAENGRVMQEGISTVILGKPNAGKSTLMNLLSGEERAIVTDIAGTTRDTLTESIRLGGITLNVTDTAGIRDSADPVERIGIARAKEAAENADLVLCVIDSSEPLDENDLQVLEKIKNKKAIVLFNKSDLSRVVSVDEVRKMTPHPVIEFSAKDGTGLKETEEMIRELFYQGEIDFNEEIYITAERQRRAIEDALSSIEMTEKSISLNMPEDFFSIDLQNAYASLGSITGDTVGDDVINEIFSKFCMGK